MGFYSIVDFIFGIFFACMGLLMLFVVEGVMALSGLVLITIGSFICFDYLKYRRKQREGA